MKKRAILVDGNNLLFRSYYATAYNGNLMKNSKGMPTNALFGFINMINKIILEEKPEYMMIAFDKGHNFRKDLYDNYKDGRIETPNDLKIQFPIAKELCTLLGIKYIEYDNYEADDIIGTFAKMADNDREYNATIISSDKDLLQLISDEVNVKLLKQHDYIIMDTNTFKETYGVEPIKMIDIKSLMGDPSDNIPGVKGIGEKTALSLLQKYGSLDEIYNHIDEISGKTKEKLISDKDNAYFSYKLATIYKDIDLNMTFDDIKYNGADNLKLIDKYKELEFNSFLKNIDIKSEIKTDYELVKGKLDIKDIFAFYLELDDINYHKAKMIGASIYDGKTAYFLDEASLLLNRDLLKNVSVTYDNKKNIVYLSKHNICLNSKFDTLIASYLLNYNVKDDISYLAGTFNISIPYYEDIVSTKNKLSEEEIRCAIVNKSKFLFDTYNEFDSKLKEEKLDKLYYEIEHPLIEVLAEMELNGIDVSKDVINELKEDISQRVKELENKIYSLAGEEFNISSPKQLAYILYDKLNLPKGRGKNAQSTAHEVLLKYKNYHPIIEEIISYRNLNKLLTTYLSTFNDYVCEDGKIHTIYKQTGTRTGRLSSIEPNLQNIPIRSEDGKLIRKAFLPSKDGNFLLSSDYSQIELRILAHISNCSSLINAFRNKEDIHTHVASDIFNISESEVTSNMRRTAKAVIFGIVYGISGFGLGENLDISAKQAKEYIDKYLSLYKEVDTYMKEIVEKTRNLGYVRTLFNRKREIPEIKNTNYLIRSMGDRMALNTPIQGTSADILKMAMIQISKKLKEKKYKSKMLLQVHDELIFDVFPDELNEIKDMIENTMENVVELSVPLKVGIEYGINWYDVK